MPLSISGNQAGATTRAAVRWLVVLAWLAAVGPAPAAVRLAEIFTDHTVLQRGQPVPVWGWADAGEKVTIEFSGQTQTVQVGEDGRWTVELAPMIASATPGSLVARGRDTSVEINDVVVGEVWLFSGQSNMAYLLSNVARPSDRDQVSPALAQREIAEANDPMLREFRVDNRPAARPRDDVPTQTGWMTWSKTDAPKWAAMARYFGKQLRVELGVPVGIVMCSWGGSSCSAWISADALRGPALQSVWPEQVPEWRPNLAQSHLFNGMLHPLAPFAIAGFGWYQGETEAAPYHNPYLHRYLLAEMIQDWRQLWRRDIPFYFMQLPNRDNEPRWVVVRESQAAVLRLPGTVMIPTIDIGQAWDLHPRNKQDVAARFAAFALAREYGRGDWPGCPLFERAEPAGPALRLIFRDADQGFKTTDGKAPAEFLVAGDGVEFQPAEARIEGKTIIVSAATVPRPTAVRYAWTASPKVNLVNVAGVAVPPFRSDVRPVDGQEKLALSLPVAEKLSQVFTGGSIAAGRATGWQACADLGRLGADAPSIVETAGTTADILVRGFATRAGQDPSPLVYWTAGLEHFDAARGITLEAKAYVTRIGNAERGFDLEAGLRRNDGTFRRYLVTVFPLRLHTFQNNPAPRNTAALETHVLRSDMDTRPAVYRLAVRPDGVAQIYRDQELLGTTTGEIVKGETPARSYLRIGKTVGGGEWAANIYHVAYDTTGAFAPAAR